MRIKTKQGLYLKLRAPKGCKRCGAREFTLAQFPSGRWAYDCDACGLRRGGMDARSEVEALSGLSSPLAVLTLVE